jgi:hypothetical protein
MSVINPDARTWLYGVEDVDRNLKGRHVCRKALASCIETVRERNSDWTKFLTGRKAVALG